MIAECLIFLATFAPQGVLTQAELNEYRACQETVPFTAFEHFDLIQEHFAPINWDTAIKVSWCESRHNTSALRTAEGNFDSGYFQFVSWTWNWIAEKYELPKWNDYVITYRDRPWDRHPKETQSDLENYKFIKVQFSPYYNILFASLLVEDIYGYVQWDDWSSSKWCWANTEKFIERVAKEKSMS